MIDPITAMAAASAAYNGIKKAVSVGREISGMAGSISKWSKAVSDLDFLEKKAQDLRAHISWHYGPAAWEEIVRIEAEQRKQQRELVYKKQEFIDNCINWSVGILALLAGSGILFIIVYFLGARQGKW